jgi:hypothetical protein
MLEIQICFVKFEVQFQGSYEFGVKCQVKCGRPPNAYSGFRRRTQLVKNYLYKTRNDATHGCPTQPDV